MKRLPTEKFQRARAFLFAHARPLERARFAHEFLGAPASAVLDELAKFRNADGGFGHALEADLRMSDSHVLATATALDVLVELGASHSEPLVKRAFTWLAERFDPEVPGWRCVPENVDSYAHAPHWSWELHKPGGPWPHLVIPGAWLLFHFRRWPALAPRPILETLEPAVAAHLRGLTGPIGPDSFFYAARVAAGPALAHLRALATREVTRDPSAWLTYSAKPLRLAPTPDSPLAECLASETAANLDWEIDHQAPDGSWLPNWDWQGRAPADWEVARREWQGELTLRALQSLRAYGRLESV
jgi:hypothetical protein